MLHAVQFLLQRARLALTGDVLAAFQQLFGEFQFLPVLCFKLIESNDKSVLFLLNDGQAFTMALIADSNIFQQRLLLHFKRGNLRANAGQLFRHRVEAHPDARCGGVEQINRLVRQLTARQIAAGKRNSSAHRIVGNVHVMVLGVTGFQTTEHQAGGVIVRLIDFYHLETTLQGRVAFEVLLVLAPGSGRNGTQFTTRQRRFQQVRCIGAPRLVAGADDGMRFINK